jgi:HK97 family phage portal protein
MNLGRLLTKAVTALGGGYWSTGPAKLTEPALGQWLGGGSHSHAGKSVTVDSALQVAAAWACIRLISQTWGTLPVEVKVWDGTAMRPTRDHPLYDLLHSAPNSDMSATEFWSALGVNLLAWGNAYAEVHRTRGGLGGRVVALTPLRPEFVTVRRDDGGALVYRYTDPDGQRDLDEDSVLHIKYMTRDGINGLSPIANARHTLGLAMAADETAGRLFANGMRIGGYISAPNTFTPQQRPLAATLLREFQGSIHAGKVPILENSWKYESVSMPPQEAELLATRSFEITEIARVYGVPPWMIGYTEKATSFGAGLESQMLAFHTLTMRPILKNAEGAIRRRLIPPGERNRIEVDFNYEGLLRADSQARAAFLKTMIEAGVMTINEGRAREGLAPIAGGDQSILQSNMLPLTALGQATTRADLPVATPEAAE